MPMPTERQYQHATDVNKVHNDSFRAGDAVEFEMDGIVVEATIASVNNGIAVLTTRFGEYRRPVTQLIYKVPNLDRNPAYDGPMGILTGYGEYDDELPAPSQAGERLLGKLFG